MHQSAQQPGSPCLMTVEASALTADQPMAVGSEFDQHATGTAHQHVAKGQHNVFKSLVGQALGPGDAANVVLQLQLRLPVTSLLSF